MKQPVEKAPNPFMSSTHEVPPSKPLVTRDGLNAAARKTSGVVGWIHSLFHGVAMLLFGLSIGAMFGAFAGSWLLQSGRVPTALLIHVSRWSWAVGGALGFALTLWLVRSMFGRKRIFKNPDASTNSNDFAPR